MIPSRQIGWGAEENLLAFISKQLDYLISVAAAAGSGSGLTLAEVIAATYFTNEYLSSEWVGDNLTVVHNLGTSSPNITTYEFGSSVIFSVLIVDDNTFILSKNPVNSAPGVLKIGVSK